MTDSRDAAEKIMALVDEFPSEPFSFERKAVLDKLTDLMSAHSLQIDDERDVSYHLGYDDGYDEGYEAGTEENDQTIQDLEEQIEELKEDQEQKYQDAFTEGYEAARIEYDLN